jgi:hypothetical protein
VGDDANLAGGQRGIGLDPVDERRAARCRREQPFQGDDRRPLPRDDVERLQRLRVRKREGAAHVVALFQDRQVFGRGDEDGRGHSRSV